MHLKFRPSASGSIPAIECDGYVPLVARWREAYVDLVYHRLGDFERTLVEFAFQKPELDLVQLTIVSVPAEFNVDEVKNCSEECDNAAVPYLATGSPNVGERVDESASISWNTEANRLSILFSPSGKNLGKVYGCGSIDFFVTRENELFRIDFKHLNDAAIANFRQACGVAS